MPNANWLFKADSSKGVIFYLHGNAGSIDSWGWVANLYEVSITMFYARLSGYRKSGSQIPKWTTVDDDIQTAYNELKKLYMKTIILC